jgi:monoterpene epsilon-lactone hydrolase
MRLSGIPPALLAPGLRVFADWGMSPSIDWPTSRRRIELGLKLPGPPRGTRVAKLAIGGVPCEELRPAGVHDERAALLYLHGGGYVIGSPATHRALAGVMARAFAAPVIVADYRLAPEHPHPAALEDALAVWRALVKERGLEPGRIAVAGDSAGGGLSIVLAQALRAAGEPLPAALGLISPWVDLTLDHPGPRPPAPRDVLLTPERLQRFAGAYLAGGTPADSPAVSPLHGDLRGLPPLVVHVGGAELLRGDGEAIIRRAAAAGVPVVQEILPGLWHDSHLSARVLAEPAGGAPARMASELRARLRSGAPGAETSV